MKTTYLITGGAGFIGSNYVRNRLQDESSEIVNLDKLTYAGNPETVRLLNENPRHHFIESDILCLETLRNVLQTYQPDYVVHFAAESHVDRSIVCPEPFIRTNILGTYRLLEAVKEYFHDLAPAKQERFRLLHVSTDEVFGTLGLTGEFHENNPYAPSTPYSATKGASNLLVQAWHKTYKIPVLTVNCSNNYGPFQAPEKLMPKTILNAITQNSITIHGNGEHVRDWLFVDDCCNGIQTVLEHGRTGENYSIGGNCEKSTFEVVERICEILDDAYGNDVKTSFRHHIRYVPDRAANDFRYSLNTGKIEGELGWKPQTNINEGLLQTVNWYLENKDWLYAAAERLESPSIASTM